MNTKRIIIIILITAIIAVQIVSMIRINALLNRMTAFGSAVSERMAVSESRESNILEILEQMKER